MSFNFLALPGEIRNIIYSMILTHKETVVLRVEAWMPDSQRRRCFTPALLCVSRRIHDEAAAVLYSRNKFSIGNPVAWNSPFTEMDFGLLDLRLFLGTIGPRNASLIRHLCVACAGLASPHPWNSLLETHPALSKDFVPLIRILRDHCTGLRVLETLPCSTSEMVMELAHTAMSHAGVTREVIWQMAGHFKSLSSVKHIILNLYDLPFYGAIVEEMRDYGWDIRLKNGYGAGRQVAGDRAGHSHYLTLAHGRRGASESGSTGLEY